MEAAKKSLVDALVAFDPVDLSKSCSVAHMYPSLRLLYLKAQGTYEEFVGDEIEWVAKLEFIAPYLTGTPPKDPAALRECLALGVAGVFKKVIAYAKDMYAEQERDGSIFKVSFRQDAAKVLAFKTEELRKLVSEVTQIDISSINERLGDLKIRPADPEAKRDPTIKKLLNEWAKDPEVCFSLDRAYELIVEMPAKTPHNVLGLFYLLGLFCQRLN